MSTPHTKPSRKPIRTAYKTTLRFTQPNLQAIHDAAKDSNRTVANWIACVCERALGAGIRL